MPANMGVARRLEAANQRINAAIAEIAPDTTPPAPSRNRGFAEVARAEWIAETLEAMAGGSVGERESGDDLESMSVEDLRNMAAEREIEGRSGMKKAELIGALQEAE